MSRDDTKLAFSTAYRYPRVFMRGSAVITDGVTVTHNLGYVPYIKIAALYPNGKYGNTANAGETPQGTSHGEISVFTTANTTSVTISMFDNTSAGRSITVFYKIYAETVV